MKFFRLLFLIVFGFQCQKNLNLLSEIPLGGDFSYPDKKGINRDLSSFPEKTVVVFFGYTQCPDFCPNILSRLKKVTSSIAVSDQPKIVFLSLDPERDSPEVADKFASFYSPNAVGYSFDKNTTEKIMKQYAVYSEKNPDGVTIDHSTYLYVLDKNRKTRALLKSTDSEAHILSVLQEMGELK